MFIKKEPLKLVSSKSMTMLRPIAAGCYTLSELTATDDELIYLITGGQEEVLVCNKYMTSFVRQDYNYNNIIYSRFISNIVNRLSMLIEGERGNSKKLSDTKALIHDLEKRQEKVKCHVGDIIGDTVLNISRIYGYKASLNLYSILGGKYNFVLNSQLKSVYYGKANAANKFIRKYSSSVLPVNRTNNVWYIEADESGKYYNSSSYYSSNKYNYKRKYHNQSEHKIEYFNVYNFNASNKSEHDYQYTYESYRYFKSYFDEVINCKYLSFYKKSTAAYKVIAYKVSLYNIGTNKSVEEEKYIPVTDRRRLNKSIERKYGKTTAYNKRNAGILENKNGLIVERIFEKYLTDYYLYSNSLSRYIKSEMKADNNNLTHLYGEEKSEKERENHISGHKKLLISGVLFNHNIINTNKAVIESIKKKNKADFIRNVKTIKRIHAEEMTTAAKGLKHIHIIYNRLKSFLRHTENIEEYSRTYSNEDISKHEKRKKEYFRENILKRTKNIKVHATERITRFAENIKGSSLVYPMGIILRKAENMEESTTIYPKGIILRKAENIKEGTTVYSKGTILRQAENIEESTTVYPKGTILKQAENIGESTTEYSKGTILKQAENIGKSSTVYLKRTILKQAENIGESTTEYSKGTILKQAENIGKSSAVYLKGTILKQAENIRKSTTVYSGESILKHRENIEESSAVYSRENILKHGENIKESFGVYSRGTILRHAENIMERTLTHLRKSMLKHTESIHTYFVRSILGNTENIGGNSLIYQAESVFKNTENVKRYSLSNKESIKKYLTGSISGYKENIKRSFAEYFLEKTSGYTQKMQKLSQQSWTENVINKAQQYADREMLLNKEWHRLVYTGQAGDKGIRTPQNVSNMENVQNINTVQNMKSTKNINAVENIEGIREIQNMQDMKAVQAAGSLLTKQGNIINRTENLEDILLEQERIEEINKMIDVRVQSQVKNISRQVYETIERRLQGEKRRRGF